MASNIFAQSPLEYELSNIRGLRPRSAQPQQQQAVDPKQFIDGIATKYNVPANVLFAIAESSRANDVREIQSEVEGYAAQISQYAASGKPVEGFLKERFGANAEPLLERSYQIADALYPAQEPEKGGLGQTAKDLALQAAGSVVKGVGAAVEGAGRVYEESNLLGNRSQEYRLTIDDNGKVSIDYKPREAPQGPIAELSQKAGDKVRGVGEWMQSGVSKEAKQALQASTPDGDLFKPWTWTLGKNPSIKGYAMLSADVFGSLVSVVAASIMAGPVGAAAVGGAQGAGAAAEQARGVIDEMASTVDGNGVSVLERESAYYREAIASGKSPEEALRLTKEAASQVAAIYTAPISAFGGAATSKILSSGFRNAAGRSFARQMSRTGATSALEEGLQEAAETIATRFGVEAGAGVDLNVTDGTFGDFLMGAIGGAPFGAGSGGIGGARGKEAGDGNNPEDGGATPSDGPTPNDNNQAYGASPQPDSGSPGGESGSSPDEGAAAPDAAPPPPPGGPDAGSGAAPYELAQEDMVAPPPPMDGVARAADEVAAVQDTIAPAQEETIFPDMKPGKDVVLTDPDGRRIDAVFLGETDGGVRVRVAGEPITLTRQEFDAAMNGSKAAEGAQANPASDLAKGVGGIGSGAVDSLYDHLWSRIQQGQVTETSNGDPSPVLQAAKSIIENGRPLTREDIPALAAEVVRAQEGGDFQAAMRKIVKDWAPGSLNPAETQVKPDLRSDPTGPAKEALDAARQAQPRAKTDAEPQTSAQALERVSFIEQQAKTSGWNARLTKLRDKYTKMAANLSEQEAGAPAQVQMKQDGTPFASEKAATQALRNRRLNPKDYNITPAPDGGFIAEPKKEENIAANPVDQGVAAKTATEPNANPAHDTATEVSPDQQADIVPPATNAAPKAKGQEAVAQKPNGYSYKLADSLSTKGQNTLAKYRDSTGGETVGEIDAVVRRAEAELRRKGKDIRQADDAGRFDGAHDQMATIVREGESIAREIIDQMAKEKTGEIHTPERDEATGEWESDGSPMGRALEWLQNVEAMGLPSDTVDQRASDGIKPVAQPKPMPAGQVFPPVKKTINLDLIAKKEGFISPEEAAQRLQFWKDTAARIGETEANKRKIIVSLFDYTGAWSQPFVDAGYQVIRHDIKVGSNLLYDAWVAEQLDEHRQAGLEVYGVLSACPCTTFSGAGARWWKDLHDKESPEALVKVFGEQALASGAKSPLEYNKMLVEATREIVRLTNPTGFHVLENPIGRIEKAAGMPKPTLRFHPHNFGDPYTKRTQLFGPMRTDLPLANVEPVEGSKMQSKLRGDNPADKEKRSTTPEGFAYAFFMANDPQARKVKDRAHVGDPGKGAPARREMTRKEWEALPDDERMVWEDGQEAIRVPHKDGYITEPVKIVPKGRKPAKPMKKPDERIQPDLLGGKPKTETEMADEERTRRAWGRLRGMIEGDRVADVDERIGEYDILGNSDQSIAVRHVSEGAPGGKVEIVNVTSADQAIRDIGRIVRAKAPTPKTGDGEKKAAAKPAKALPAKPAKDRTEAQDRKSLRKGDLVPFGDFKVGVAPSKTHPKTGKVTEHKAFVVPDGGKGQMKIATSRSLKGAVDAAIAAAKILSDNPNIVDLLKKFGSRPLSRRGDAIIATKADSAKDLMEKMTENGSAVRIGDKTFGVVFDVTARDVHGEISLNPSWAFRAEGGTYGASEQTSIGLSQGGVTASVPDDAIRDVERALKALPDTRTKMTKAEWEAIPEDYRHIREDGTHTRMILDDDGVTKSVPVEITDLPSAKEIAKEARKADRSPTDAQKEAENYKKGHIKWNGLEISIENAKGSTRSGKDANGNTWSVKMPAHYGYIKRTKGADGDHVDVYMGEHPESEKVFAINQYDAETGKFDEHKIMLGFQSWPDARAAYDAAFNDGKGPDRRKKHVILTVGGFKNWLEHGDTSKPMTAAWAENNKTTGAARASTTKGPRVIVNEVGEDGLTDAERQAGKPPLSRKDTDRSTETGPFGPILRGYEGDWRAAALELERRQSGEAVGALSHPEIKEPIALVWGEEGTNKHDGFGLSKILAWHPEVLDDLQGRLSAATVTERTDRSVQLRSDRDNIGIRLKFDGAEKVWLLTAFERGRRRAERSSARLRDLWSDSTSSDPTAPTEDSRSDKKNQGTKPLFEGKRADDTSILSIEEQDELAALRNQFRDKIRNQLNSGLDPELVAIGAKMARIYIKAGARRFKDLLRSMMEDLGLTFEQAQPYARNAYNQVRDDMDLSGENIDGMDDARAVLDAVKEIKKQASSVENLEKAPTSDKGAKAQNEDVSNDQRTDVGDGGPSAEEGRKDSQPGQGQTGEIRQETGDRSGEGSRSPERAGKRPEPRTDGEGDRVSERARRGDHRVAAKNHVIKPGELQVKAGAKTRARNSVAAIRVLRELEASGLDANEEQRQALALYGGAGTLAGALPRSDGSFLYPDIAKELAELLTDEEMATLSKTSQYAFYTAEPALRAMWHTAERLGIAGDPKVFEPGMGIGGFAGTIPADIKGAKYTGIELDHITAKIAAKLYPGYSIKQGDFIEAKPPRDFYDLVIGNPPFAGTKIQSDPDYPQRFMLHDYFFAKSLDTVRPGGLLMFVTSAGTMNKRDTAARDYLADRADLVGAIRLPQTAFKENGTEVTTDIVILRKRLDGEKEANPAWREVEKVTLPDKEGGTGEAFVNKYFIEHPEMILGEQGLYDTLTAGPRIGVRERPGADLRKDLFEAIKRLPENIVSDPSPDQAAGVDALDVEHAETKPGSYYLKGDELYRFDGRAGVKVEPRSRQNTKGMPKEALARVKKLVRVRNALRDVYAADMAQSDATEARKRLNNLYDRFVKEHGPIGLEIRTERRPSRVEMERKRFEAYEDARNAGEDFDIGSFDPSDMIDAGAKLADIAKARAEAMKSPDYSDGDFNVNEVPPKVIIKRPNIDPFLDDPEAFRLLAIEKYDPKTETATKTRVFTENAVSRAVTPEINSPEDALLHVLAMRGIIDIDMIADLAKSDPATVIAELEGKIFKNPETGRWETRAKYLSGNVRKKLEAAEAASQKDPALAPNVEALREVQPAPVTSEEIRVPLGAHWFDPSIYSEFARSLGLRLEASFKKNLGIWVVNGSENEAAAQNEYGTPDLPFGQLMSAAMNNKKIEIRRTTRNADGSTTTFTDETATQQATDKAAELQEKFTEWLWADPARKTDLEQAYNRTFNAEVAPKYDGAYLTTPGVHTDWQWRPHQSSVIARVLQSGNTYMAHTVGAGKTSAMIGAAMEGRRLGLVKKPMFVVPNHMLVQFAKEFYEQYPLANIAVADERNFHKDRRKEFVAQIGLGDYDAIIITHSAFGRIPPSEASRARAVKDMLSDVRETLEESDDEMGTQRAILGSLKSIGATLGVDVNGMSKGKGSTRKKIEAILEAAEQRVKRMLDDTRKDQVFDFDELGVDQLFVDEAHLFRKLSFATRNGTIKGIDPAGSQMAMDLFVKTRAINDKTPGRGIVFASGTPITNTMAEAYSISRYLQPQALAERGISAFDAWAATFGQTDNALEQNPDGGYKMVTRFSKFVNTPELSLMMRQVMDVVSGNDLDQYVTRPKIKGGKRNLVVVEPSSEVKEYQRALAARMQNIKNRKGPVKKGDDILLSVIGDGRLSAIDPRLVDPNATGNGSKLERMIQNIYRVWKGSENDPADRSPLYGTKPEGGYTDQPVEYGPTTQIVFSTLGVKPTRHNPSFSVHKHIRASLIKMGVPASEIVLADDLKTHAMKQRAFADMNEGKKRILIGSKSLFTGVNAQRRIAAVHNLDPLWYPADDEQRNGRALRQGNMNKEVEIFDYSTKGTYDSTMWQMMGRKAAFIESFFRGDPNMREMEDLGEASQYEQAKALTTSDPRVLQLTEMKAERDKLLRQKNGVRRQKSMLQSKISQLKPYVDRLADDLSVWQDAAAKVEDTGGDKFSMFVGGKPFDTRKEAGEALIDAANDALNGDFSARDKVIGKISGFNVLVTATKADMSTEFSVEAFKGRKVEAGWSIDPVAVARRIEGALQNIARMPGKIESAIERDTASIEEATASLAKVEDFKKQAELDKLTQQIDDLEAELAKESVPENTPPSQDGPIKKFGSDESGAMQIPHVDFGKWVKDTREFASSLLTDAMQGRAGLLSLVPGRALFVELGGKLGAAQHYIRLKEEMDALRNDWQARTDKVARRWLDLMRKKPDQNEKMMDLMHRATLAGVDPSKPLGKDVARVKQANLDVEQFPPGDPRRDMAEKFLADVSEQEKAHAALSKEFDELSGEFQRIFRRVALEYSKIADQFEAAVIENIENAMKIGLKKAERAYRKEMQRITDEGLEGAERDDAIAAAEHRINMARQRNGWSKKARLAQLRSQFEENRLNGVYFPLARFGNYFVTLRDATSGRVVSFSRFEKKRDQARFIRTKERDDSVIVSHGVLGDGDGLRSEVDPSFVADIQELLGDFNADPALMDMVWQKWLETLPDQSIRTSRIHRKGREGFSRDAYRAFANHMFHASHQLARLKYGLQMGEALNDAEEEASNSDDPERSGLVVSEMRKRHEFTMNPKGGAAATAITSLAFVWYLGATPAAAIVNLTQTTILGIPILSARFRKAGASGVAAELGRAGRDFATGKLDAKKSKNITHEEIAAINEAYRRGTIDKSQAHELASVAESGVEYSGVREKWMRRISFLFHHAERANREITFLAAFRLAKKDGAGFEDAVGIASNLTWKVHFDYQNTSRPRLLQNDTAKVLLVFRQFTINMIWRLFRDAHQSLKGATKDERTEARRQLVGTTLMLLSHAGIRGVWGYGLLTMLLAAFFPGDDDDVDAWLQDALLMEGDTPGVAAWNYAMGMALNGIPGQVLGVNLSERIGMPNLWFRGSNRDLEGQDLYDFWVGEFLGPVYSIGSSFFRGASYLSNGDWWRGTEAMLPKFMRDVSKSVRYGVNGVETRGGDPILENVSPYQALVQAIGFTPAPIAERYKINSLMKNRELRIVRKRSALQKRVAKYIIAGKPIPQSALEKVQAFNEEYPEYPITPQTVRQSAMSRIRASQRNEFGIQINRRLNDRIRGEAPPLVYK